MRDWRNRPGNRAKAVRLATRHRLRKFGLTEAGYRAMVETQEGRCAICGEVPSGYNGSLHVDHNHKTGMVRSLLCGHCNMGIGHFRESREFLARAIKYLENYDDACSIV